jgi:hypothetical protein
MRKSLVARGRRVTVLVAATATVFAGLVAAGPPAQAAARCWSPSTNGEGYIITTAPTDIQTGPYGACDSVLVVAANRKLWLWCRHVNEYGNTWLYGRLPGQSGDYYGWVYGGDADYFYFDDNGDGYVDLRTC